MSIVQGGAGGGTVPLRPQLSMRMLREPGTENDHTRARSIAEASPTQLPPAALDRIMLRMLRSRISRRVITEQHLALTAQFRERQRKGKSRAAAEDETRVGIVDTKLNAADVVRKCAELIKALGGPESEVPIIIEGATERTFAYISEHLE